MNDISAFGLRVNLTASETFPAGILITQFADDADPIDSPSIQIKDKAMGLNGDLVTWSKANPVPFTINVIPDSDDDINLSVLFEANRVGKGKQGARDVINMVVIFPNGNVTSYTAGTITDGQPSNSAQNSGRMKSKAYGFAFENVNRT